MSQRRPYRPPQGEEERAAPEDRRLAASAYLQAEYGPVDNVQPGHASDRRVPLPPEVLSSAPQQPCPASALGVAHTTTSTPWKAEAAVSGCGRVRVWAARVHPPLPRPDHFERLGSAPAAEQDPRLRTQWARWWLRAERRLPAGSGARWAAVDRRAAEERRMWWCSPARS